MTYSIPAYGAMIADRIRMDAYVEALRRAVKPGHVVLDIGTGTGIFAVLARQFGARRVYAVEPSDAIELARQTAAANGFGGDIEFHQGLSTELELPERADVIVSDLRGTLPFYGRHIPSIVDARRRLLAPGGTLIPQADDIWCACVTSVSGQQRLQDPWGDGRLGIDLSAGRTMLANSVLTVGDSAGPSGRGAIAIDAVLTAPTMLGGLDYHVVEDPKFTSTRSLEVTSDGTAHGICIWFDAHLFESIGFSNAVDRPALVYGRAFFPWPEAVPLRAGEHITLDFGAHLVGAEYVWTWNSRVDGKADFRQSSYFGQCQVPDKLRRAASNHVPVVNDDGVIDRKVIEMMDGGRTIAEIARRIAADYPKRFADSRDALTRVGELSIKYSR